MAKWATITDDFPGSSLGSLWAGWYGTHTVSGNRVGQTTSVYNGFDSVDHDLSESSVLWKNEPDTTGGYTGGTIRRAGTTIMTAYYKGDATPQLVCEYDNGGTASTISIAYDATNHLWFRFRHTGTTVYFDTAPDGNTWTNRHSGACTATEAGTVDVQMEAGPFPSAGTGSGYVSKLNLAPAAAGKSPPFRRYPRHLLRR